MKYSAEALGRAGDKYLGRSYSEMDCQAFAERCMADIASHYAGQGIHVIREMNPGNHFRDAELRTAKGIRAMLAYA